MSTYCLVRIEYKDPEGVVYRNMSATEYPHFLETYPDKALTKGLEVKKISIEKQFEEE